MTSPADRFAAGLRAARAGRYRAAVRELGRAASEAPDAQTFTLLGKMLVHAGRVEEARSAFCRALAIDPASASALACRRAIDEETGRERRREAMARAGRVLALGIAAASLAGSVVIAHRSSTEVRALRGEARALRGEVRELRGELLELRGEVPVARAEAGSAAAAISPAPAAPPHVPPAAFRPRFGDLYSAARRAAYRGEHGLAARRLRRLEESWPERRGWAIVAKLRRRIAKPGRSAPR